MPNSRTKSRRRKAKRQAKANLDTSESEITSESDSETEYVDANMPREKENLPSFKVNVPVFNKDSKNKTAAWADFELQCQSIFRTPNYEELSDARKVALVLNWLGFEAEKHFQTWTRDTQEECQASYTVFMMQYAKQW